MESQPWVERRHHPQSHHGKGGLQSHKRRTNRSARPLRAAQIEALPSSTKRRRLNQKLPRSIRPAHCNGSSSWIAGKSSSADPVDGRLQANAANLCRGGARPLRHTRSHQIRNICTKTYQPQVSRNRTTDGRSALQECEQYSAPATIGPRASTTEDFLSQFRDITEKKPKPFGGLGGSSARPRARHSGAAPGLTTGMTSSDFAGRQPHPRQCDTP